MTKTELLRKTLGTNIRTLRTKMSLTQAQLAELADISITQLTNLERGKSWVSCEMAIKLSNALNVEPFILIMEPSSRNAPADLQLKWQIEEIKKTFRERIVSFSLNFENDLDKTSNTYDIQHNSKTQDLENVADSKQK